MATSKLWSTAFKAHRVTGYTGRSSAKSSTSMSSYNGNTSASKAATISAKVTQALIYRLSRKHWVIETPDFILVEMETHSIGKSTAGASGSTYRTAVKWEKGSETLQVAVMSAPVTDQTVPVEDILNADRSVQWAHGILWMPQLFKSDAEFEQNYRELQDVWASAGELKNEPALFICNDNLYWTRSEYNIENVDLVPCRNLGLTPGMVVQGYNGANVSDSFLDPIVGAPATPGRTRSRAATTTAPATASPSNEEFFKNYQLETDYDPQDFAYIPAYDPGEVAISTELRMMTEMVYSEINSRKPVRDILLFGEGGSGKSMDAKLLAQALGLPYRFMNLSMNMEESHLSGAYLPNDDGTFRFQTTEFLEIAERGGVIELMELNYAKPGALGILNSFMESPHKIVSGTGEVIDRHPHCIIVATINVGYAGTLPMNLSLKDRFDHMQEVKKLPKEVLSEIVVRESGNTDTALVDKLIDAADKIAKKIKADDIEGLCSTRQIINWARNTRYTRDPKAAAWSTILPGVSLETEVQEDIFNKILNPMF